MVTEVSHVFLCSKWPLMSEMFAIHVSKNSKMPINSSIICALIVLSLKSDCDCVTFLAVQGWPGLQTEGQFGAG